MNRCGDSRGAGRQHGRWPASTPSSRSRQRSHGIYIGPFHRHGVQSSCSIYLKRSRVTQQLALTCKCLPENDITPNEKDNVNESPEVGSVNSVRENAERPFTPANIIQAVHDVNEEDDLSPLRTALDKAKQRAERYSEIREANEQEALDIAGMAIALKDKLTQAKNEADETHSAIARREEQVARLTAQKEQILAEQTRLLDAAQSDVIVSVDSPADEEPASVGDWDIESLQNGSVSAGNGAAGSGADSLSEEEKAVTELKAACIILDERIAAYSEDLNTSRARLQGLWDRVHEAEEQYAEADAAAASAMRETESAVKAELEASAVYQQVKAAVEAAERSVGVFMEDKGQSVDGAGKEAGSAAEMSTDEVRTSPVVAATAEIAKLEAEADAAPLPSSVRPLWRRPALIAAAAAAALFVYAVAMTPFGTWLVEEVGVVSAFVRKVSTVCSAIMDRVPWLQLEEMPEGLLETIAILATSVIAVPSVIKFIPGGSAVLGFLLGGALIGPHGLGVIKDIAPVAHLGEMGVVFLLFNIGLELSLDRLSAMAKAVFGMGLAQFALTTLAIACVATYAAGYAGPTAIIVGGALALSSTAVAMNVLQERGETGTRHGRATFAVLLLQDLAVVVLLMLIPLLAGGDQGGLLVILTALSTAAIKALICIAAIIATGRTLLRPVFRRIAALANAELFAATTLLVILGASVVTKVAGLSLALGAFLAGLLMAETEYVLQVESDIAPYKGLLMGLFFISVGMEISFGVFIRNWPLVVGSLLTLLVGKVALMALAGRPFGMSRLSAVRSGLYLAPGGEFAFVVLNEAVAAGLLPATDIPVIFFVVVVSMAMTPYLATLGGQLGKMFETTDVAKLQPTESETAELKDHVIIMGFGRVGQTIAQLLSERLIPFVALDVRSERVSAGKAADLPVYFGDAGSPAVLQHVGALRARCAVITLDTPGANYRAVWAMNKHFPHAKIYVRAHDVEHGLNLEKAGATAVVPEILEPSLQLAAAVLSSMNLKAEEISEIVDAFRRSHISDLSRLSSLSGGSLGYGWDAEARAKGLPASSDGKDEEVILVSPHAVA